MVDVVKVGQRQSKVFKYGIIEWSKQHNAYFGEIVSQSTGV